MYFKIHQLVSSLVNGHILVIGDIMLDRYIHGSVERLSPEAPVPVMQVDWEQEMLGGAGNVARNISSLGAKVGLVGSVGNDIAGKRVIQLIKEEDQIDPLCIVSDLSLTTVKTRFVASSQQLLRADRESRSALKPEDYEKIVSHLSTEIDNFDVIVVSDYAKGLLSDELLKKIISLARSSSKPVIVDPKSSDLKRYSGASLLTPNRSEISKATGVDITDDESAEIQASIVLQDSGVGAVLVTRGSEGMTLCRKGKKPLHIPALAQEIFDVSGAGDTVIASVAAALAVGHNLEDASMLANVAASIVVSKTGTSTVHPDEISKSAKTNTLISSKDKIVQLSVAIERVQELQRQRRCVVFTNGCFDLIHPGHVSLLEKARAAGDILIVGINSDDSVQRLKGQGRPVQSVRSRASVLAALSAVDLVVEFDQNTPLKLIKNLRPDVLVKGADYVEDEVVGRDFVQAYGGKIVLIELSDGHSTTGLIADASRGLGGNS